MDGRDDVATDVAVQPDGRILVAGRTKNANGDFDFMLLRISADGKQLDTTFGNAGVATGRFAGSVSGGCIEGAVIREAMDVIEDGKARLLDFGVTDTQAWDVGLACGGKIQVYVERLE